MKFDPDKHRTFATFEDACAAQHSAQCKDTPTKIEVRRVRRHRDMKLARKQLYNEEFHG